MTDEHLIGFDARQRPRALSEAWDSVRCREYLLKPDVARILSTDGAVWPSCFRLPLPDGLPPELVEKIDTTAPLTPEWIGMNAPFWESLSKLHQHLAQFPFAPDVWTIAATCIITDEVRDGLQYGPYFAQTDPPVRNESWSFLGYDVSDGSFLSGLTNCGYRDEDFADVPRERWGTTLNDSHLFRDIEDAASFRDFSDRRIPEHSPFLVYGLYLVT